ncbi:MAG: class I SAM-dependent methyltransferase [Solirubrobacterales bacterium]|nr:class I SAM-dependent methyltransferase [Solirubrobacterales bacterium]
MDTPPRVTDPLGWGYSLANVIELLTACLEAVPTRRVLEVGSYEGELTRDLLTWADLNDATVTTVDPLPPNRLLELVADRPDLTLIEDTGAAALASLDELPDSIIIDGDHNYFTLSAELEAIAGRAEDGPLPLLLFHDAGWPHARRDTYYAPDRVPEERRQPLAHNVGLVPGDPGVSENEGLPYEWAAAREGGPENGVLTALEDFIAERRGLKLAVVPAFFGFAVIYDERAGWASRVAEILAPWDDNPILHRLESNRVDHLVRNHSLAQEIQELRVKVNRQEALLNDMLESSAFAMAERASKLKQRGEPIFSRRRINDVLGK